MFILEKFSPQDSPESKLFLLKTIQEKEEEERREQEKDQEKEEQERKEETRFKKKTEKIYHVCFDCRKGLIIVD